MTATSGEPLPQAAAIPFRIRDGVAEICIVTSSNGRKWGVPKGIVDPGHSKQETALIEAEEEAGLTGELLGSPVGTYKYRKWGMDLSVVVFLMHVQAVADEWDEMNIRSRQWVSPEQARDLIDRHPPATLLERGVKRIVALRGET